MGDTCTGMCASETISFIMHACNNYYDIVQSMMVGYKTHIGSAIDFSCTDENLKVNLDNLLIQLRAQVSPFWYHFGEAAGIETEMLDKLADNCSPQECIVEMLDYWLRRQTKLPTWRDIAKILKVINFQQLAAQIEMVYITGNCL